MYYIQQCRLSVLIFYLALLLSQIDHGLASNANSTGILDIDVATGSSVGHVKNQNGLDSTEDIIEFADDFTCFQCDNGLKGNTSCEKGEERQDRIPRMNKSQCLEPAQFSDKYNSVHAAWVARNEKKKGRGRSQAGEGGVVHICALLTQWSSKLSRPNVLRSCIAGTKGEIEIELTNKYAITLPPDALSPSGTINECFRGKVDGQKVMLCLCNSKDCNGWDAGVVGVGGANFRIRLNRCLISASILFAFLELGKRFNLTPIL